MDIYNDPTVLPILEEAARRNAIMEAANKKKGFDAPQDRYLHEQLRPAMAAIFCGLENKDMNCVAEGYVLLQNIHSTIYTPKYNG